VRPCKGLTRGEEPAQTTPAGRTFVAHRSAVSRIARGRKDAACERDFRDSLLAEKGESAGRSLRPAIVVSVVAVEMLGGVDREREDDAGEERAGEQRAPAARSRDNHLCVAAPVG
jgi:hypothetical protein